MPECQHIFWDSCVAHAYLQDNNEAYDIESIDQYLEEAEDGKWKIYMSTISLAEIRPSRLKRSAYLSDFLKSYEGAIELIAPSTNIMLIASQLRDLPYANGESKDRVLSTPDAIILATCVTLIEYASIPLYALHSYDRRGRRDYDEGKKTVPIIGYENWCKDFSAEHYRVAHRVINLRRCQPIHSSPRLVRSDGSVVIPLHPGAR